MRDPWEAARLAVADERRAQLQASADAQARLKADIPLIQKGTARLSEIGRRAALELDGARVPQPPIWSYVKGLFGGNWKRTVAPAGVWGLRVRLIDFAISNAGLFYTNARLVSEDDHLEPPYAWVADRKNVRASELCWTQWYGDERLASPMRLQMRPTKVDMSVATRVISDTEQWGLTVSTEGEPEWWELGNMGPTARVSFEPLLAEHVVRHIDRYRRGF